MYNSAKKKKEKKEVLVETVQNRREYLRGIGKGLSVQNLRFHFIGKAQTF